MGESSDGPGTRGASSVGLVLGLGVLYVVWGSTYLGIRVAVETIPPFLMAGLRYLLAGAIMLAMAWAQGTPGSTIGSWRNAAIVGWNLGVHVYIEALGTQSGNRAFQQIHILKSPAAQAYSPHPFAGAQPAANLHHDRGHRVVKRR